LKTDLNILNYVDLFELSILLNVTQLTYRILKIFPNILNIKNFDSGFKKAFESDYNDGEKNGEKIEMLLSIFQNFFLDHKSEIVTSMKKTLNLVKARTEISVGDDDFGKEINQVKAKLWKSRDYKDIILMCNDNVKIPCHKGILGNSPLFSKFDANVDQENYHVDFVSGSLSFFLELLYLGRKTHHFE
jgi:hypothetical protein